MLKSAERDINTILAYKIAKWFPLNFQILTDIINDLTLICNAEFYKAATFRQRI